MKILFSGIQPTGLLHLGNYFGAVRNWVDIQYDYSCYFCIVDLHAVTIQYDPKVFAGQVFELALGLYSCGLDPEKTKLFIQSEVPGHADLAWIFNTVTPLGELERMTQFKDKARHNRQNINVGLLDYPVLQAADILIYKGEVVPVGQDQVQHIEFAREIARKFNSRYGRTFPECQAKLTKTPRIMGLDGESKMSKSQDNYIALLDSQEKVWEKLAPAKTDPARIRRTDAGNPEICNIFSYHKVVTQAGEQQEVAGGCRTAGIGCLDCKKKLLANLMKVMDPIQERYQELSGKRDYVRQVLDENGAKCRKAAADTIIDVKEKMGLNPVWHCL